MIIHAERWWPESIYNISGLKFIEYYGTNERIKKSLEKEWTWKK